MQIVEIQCLIFCHKVEQSAGLKFFEPAIKVENWQMEIVYFHNRITAWKETVALHSVLKRPKMMCITAIPTIVELNSIGIFHGNHTQQKEPVQSIKHVGEIKNCRGSSEHSLFRSWLLSCLSFLCYLQTIRLSKKKPIISIYRIACWTFLNSMRKYFYCFYFSREARYCLISRDFISHLPSHGQWKKRRHSTLCYPL